MLVAPSVMNLCALWLRACRLREVRVAIQSFPRPPGEGLGEGNGHGRFAGYCPPDNIPAKIISLFGMAFLAMPVRVCEGRV